MELFIDVLWQVNPKFMIRSDGISNSIEVVLVTCKNKVSIKNEAARVAI